MASYSNIALIAIIATSENYISKHPEEEIKNYFQKILDLQDELTLVNYPYAAAAAGTMCDYYRRVSKKKDLDLAQLYLNKQEELINKKVLYSTASNSSMIRYYHSRKAQFAWLNENYNEATLFFDKIWDSYSPNRSEQMEELINALYQNFHILDHLTDYIKMHTQNAFKNPDAYKYNIDRANSIYQQTDIILDSLFLKGKTKIDNDKIEEFYELGYGMSLIQHYKTGSKKYANTAYEQFEKLMNIEAFNHHLQSKLKHSNSDYAEIIQSKNQVREQIDILESSMDGSPAEKVKLDSLDRLFFSLSKQLNDSPNIFRNEKNKGASLDQIQARLGSTDLHFHLAFENISQQLYILVVSRDNVYSKIQIAPNLRYKLDLLLNKLSDPDSTGYESLLQELHQLVIEPFEEYVKGKKLTFTTTNDLSRLPFDLLMNKKNDYLCFTNPTIHSFTQFKNWEETKSEVTRFKTHLLALTNSFTDSQTGEEGFPSQLIFAEKEIEILKDRYDAKLIKSHQHAKKKFIDACQNTGIIHLALHSEVQALNPIKSRLLLSKTGNPDQDLYYHEIDDLKLSSDLVILSSCQSGLGYSKSAGSVSSLARAFQFAGAKNLVHTLWSINDESSAQFMDIFYTQLESKENLSTCLSESKKKFYEEAPLKWKHPYYWAAFVLNGEDGPVEVFPQRIFTQGFVGKYWIMTCSFMIGLILLILLYYYSKKSRLAG